MCVSLFLAQLGPQQFGLRPTLSLQTYLAIAEAFNFRSHNRCNRSQFKEANSEGGEGHALIEVIASIYNKGKLIGINGSKLKKKITF